MVNFNSFVILPALIAFFNAGSVSARNENGVFRGTFTGGPHGNGFDDADMIGDYHRRISSITLYGCNDHDHIEGMSITYKEWDPLSGNKEDSVEHGHTTSPDKMKLDLASDEYITDFWFTTYRAKRGIKSRWTRIASMGLKTNKGHEIRRCGVDAPRDAHSHVSAENSALLYLTGATGEGIDSITPYWIPKDNF